MPSASKNSLRRGYVLVRTSELIDYAPTKANAARWWFWRIL